MIIVLTVLKENMSIIETREEIHLLRN